MSDPSIASSLMARVKVLKGVAHNIGSSFTSLMNYASDDYSMGHILRFARESGINTLTIDLLNEHGEPAQLLREPISELPSRYSKMFLRLVESSGSSRELIRSAVLKVAYDLRCNQPSPIPNEPQSPYVCDISIVDIREKEYVAHFDGWWYIERMELTRPPSLAVRKWWNPFTWFFDDKHEQPH